ncbi:MAG: DUF2892 domain-containing protein [Chitinivibrionales bacterium]|nr:DUF2892 domain-containing protein [Chitinivibrionales bacterium]
MPRNEGLVDRMIRLIVAVALFALVIFRVVSGPAAIVPGIIGAISALKGLTGFCGLYALFGLRTCPSKK